MNVHCVQSDTTNSSPGLGFSELHSVYTTVNCLYLFMFSAFIVSAEKNLLQILNPANPDLTESAIAVVALETVPVFAIFPEV